MTRNAWHMIVGMLIVALCFLLAGKTVAVLSEWFFYPLGFQRGLAVILVATWILGEFNPKELAWRWGVGSLAVLAVGWLINEIG